MSILALFALTAWCDQGKLVIWGATAVELEFPERDWWRSSLTLLCTQTIHQRHTRQSTPWQLELYLCEHRWWGRGYYTYGTLHWPSQKHACFSWTVTSEKQSYRGYVRERTWALALVWCNICRLLLKRLHVLKQLVSFSHWEMSLEGSCIVADIHILSTEFLFLSEMTDLGLKFTLLDSWYFFKGHLPFYMCP